jgi:hypothetical protein
MALRITLFHRFGASDRFDRFVIFETKGSKHELVMRNIRFSRLFIRLLRPSFAFLGYSSNTLLRGSLYIQPRVSRLKLMY